MEWYGECLCSYIVHYAVCIDVYGCVVDSVDEFDDRARGRGRGGQLTGPNKTRKQGGGKLDPGPGRRVLNPGTRAPGPFG